MTWVLVLFAVMILLEAARRVSAKVSEAMRDRERRLAAERLYRQAALDGLMSICAALNGPQKPPLSARIFEADRDVKMRRELARAMERELGIK